MVWLCALPPFAFHLITRTPSVLGTSAPLKMGYPFFVLLDADSRFFDYALRSG